MKIGTQWIKQDGVKPVTVVYIDKYGVDFVYDDDKNGRVWWQLKSHFEANFKPCALGVSLFKPFATVKG